MKWLNMSKRISYHVVCVKKVGVVIVLNTKDRKTTTQEMQRQVFVVFLAMTRMKNNKNNMSWSMVLTLANIQEVFS